MKKIFIQFTILAAGIACSMITSAQTTQHEDSSITYFHRCGEIEYEEFLRSQDPMFDIKRQEMETAIHNKRNAMEEAKQSGNPVPMTQYNIPVVFHVVYNSAAQNLTDQQVQSALTQLNQDWSRTNSDAGNTPAVWQSIAVDMQVHFCLASKDPNGNPTTGIVHKSTTVSGFSSNDAVKHSSQGGDDAWTPTKYLNIWICNLTGGLLGYGAFLPVNATWGTVVHYITVGSVANSNPLGGAYGQGRTLSHEIGHCFNLFHIWGDDNGACTGSDQIADTPNMGNATSGCPSGVQTDACTAGGDTQNAYGAGTTISSTAGSNVAPGRMYQDFMDYTDDLCYNMFTAGQKAEVQSAIATYLTSVANNSSVSCNPTFALDAGISVIGSPSGNYCTGLNTPSVQLQNFGTTTLTSCTINYQLDASPANTFNWNGSLLAYQTVNITLPQIAIAPGTHTFTCSTSSPNGSTDGNSSNDTLQTTLNSFSNSASVTAPYIEGFETAGFPYNDCYLTTTGATQWNTTSIASFSGSSSLLLDNFLQTSAGVYEFITPSVDMSNVISPSMTFELAHAQLNSADADKLIVFTSTNCGTTWSQRYTKSGSSLATAGIVSSAFTPSDTSKWRLETVNIPNVSGQADTRFKFQFTSAGTGNNIYIDNINIEDINSVNEEFVNGFDLTISPNPFNDNTIISFNILEKYNVSVCVYDIVGREIIPLSDKKAMVAGKYSLHLNRNTLKAGIYFVKLNVDGYSVTKKVIVQ